MLQVSISDGSCHGLPQFCIHATTAEERALLRLFCMEQEKGSRLEFGGYTRSAGLTGVDSFTFGWRAKDDE
jgi:hypothetical protein